MNTITINNLAVAGVFVTFCAIVQPGQAASVPPGVELAARQELVRGNGAEVQSLDPHKIEGVPESYISRDLFEGLIILDENGHPVPGVAQSWQTRDNRVWLFYLRPEARWSNGQPVTAHDFVYSWQRLADPNTASPYASYLQYCHIKNSDDIIRGLKSPQTLGVKAQDDHTLQVTLSESVPYFYKMLAHHSMSPVYQLAIEKLGDGWTQPQNLVANGAFRLEQHVINERLVLVRNPRYWDNAHTILDKVTFLPISSEVADVNRYFSPDGSDMTNSGLPVELFSKLKREHPQELRVNPYLCTYYYEINNQRVPFNDPRVRTALKLGLDRNIVVNKVLAQGQIPAFTLTPPFVEGITLAQPEWRTWPQEKRNREARRLLAEAGYSADKPLTFELLYNTSDIHKKLAIAAASIWNRNLGVKVRMINQEWKTYLDSRHQGNYDVARAGWCADYNEPSAFTVTFKSDSSNNTAFYRSAGYDQALLDSVRAADEQTRAMFYGKAEQILDGDSGIIPVYYYVNVRLIKPYVGGYSGKDPLDYLYSKNLFIINE